MKPVVQSRKHYVQWTITPVSVGTTVTENIVKAEPILSVNLATDVVEGASVKAIYVELWCIGQSDSVSGNVLVSLYKDVAGATSMTQTDHVTLNDYKNKRNVIYHTQGIVNDGVANATPFIRQWFKIPKGKQRMALGDFWKMAVSTQAEATNYCGFATYKEIF